jgi:hypothetical protein
LAYDVGAFSGQHLAISKNDNEMEIRMSEINYTTASIALIDALSFEVSVGRETIISIVRFDKTWEVLFNSSNPNKSADSPVKITWLEFLEIMHKVHEFMADENERLLLDIGSEEKD